MHTQEVAPIFVGGTGRSGTTIVARILGSHRDLHMIPIEIRFIVDRGGLCDLISGSVNMEAFSRRLLGPWWHRTLPDGSTRGLHKVMEHQQLIDALDELQSAQANPGSARLFVHRVLDPIAADARRWIEMTPPNVSRGRQLLEIFPQIRLIHSARDGRDVACSVAPLNWGPSDPFSALEWWGDRMLEAHNACFGMGSENLLELRMETLIGPSRDATIEQLFRFINECPDIGVSDFVESNVSRQHSNAERWKSDIEPDLQDSFQLRYQKVLDRIAAGGFPLSRWGFR